MDKHLQLQSNWSEVEDHCKRHGIPRSQRATPESEHTHLTTCAETVELPLYEISLPRVIAKHLAHKIDIEYERLRPKIFRRSKQKQSEITQADKEAAKPTKLLVEDLKDLHFIEPVSLTWKESLFNTPGEATKYIQFLAEQGIECSNGWHRVVKTDKTYYSVRYCD